MLERSKKFTCVNSLLSSEEKEKLQRVLLRNIDVFAWNHSNMIGIDPMLAYPKMNIIPAVKSVRQKVRRFHSDHHQIIQENVDNHLRPSFIKDVKYLE